MDMMKTAMRLNGRWYRCYCTVLCIIDILLCLGQSRARGHAGLEYAGWRVRHAGREDPVVRDRLACLEYARGSTFGESSEANVHWSVSRRGRSLLVVVMAGAVVDAATELGLLILAARTRVGFCDGDDAGAVRAAARP